MPGTPPVTARQFAHIRDGVMVALLDDPRTRSVLKAWGHAAASELIDATIDEARVARFAKRIAAEGRAFVVETLGLQSPWCAYGLFEAFWRSLETRDLKPIAYTVDQIAPPIVVHFRTRPGESIDEGARAACRPLRQAERALRRAKAEWRGHEWMKLMC